MNNGQIIIFVVIGLIFAISWFYTTYLGLSKMQENTDVKSFMWVSMGSIFPFGFIMIIAVTTTLELNSVRKKAPQPKYEEVTFTVYKKI